MNHREQFLADIAKALGRDVRHIPSPPPVPANDYAHTRLTELDAQQRCDAFIECATNVMLAHCELTTEADAPEATWRLCERYGREPVLISSDDRLAALGITARLQEACGAVVWNPARGEENIQVAERAKVGVIYAEHGLTESGGVVLFSSPDCGRSVSLLPESSIFVLRKSTILPRVAQLARQLHQIARQGTRMPSCINLIGGPSSTADIELIKVVGVHGPVNAAYLIIEDC
ncbi:lactate utilization protein C [Dickeya sp. CFBP 2040]|uniref:LutC/YkgG family protein n=1 Tax=Dickeya sp. CFBP 2040 TaxID=2718531 RepID=UPI001446C8E3|nr:lactate utilization protein C [Dickeya sp. CFBP 2040]NKI73742.1 lactate utilization protein C [Dickeya sp. CFBP 2040]